MWGCAGVDNSQYPVRPGQQSCVRGHATRTSVVRQLCSAHGHRTLSVLQRTFASYQAWSRPGWTAHTASGQCIVGLRTNTGLLIMLLMLNDIHIWTYANDRCWLVSLMRCINSCCDCSNWEARVGILHLSGLQTVSMPTKVYIFTLF